MAETVFSHGLIKHRSVLNDPDAFPVKKFFADTHALQPVCQILRLSQILPLRKDDVYVVIPVHFDRIQIGSQIRRLLQAAVLHLVVPYQQIFLPKPVSLVPSSVLKLITFRQVSAQMIRHLQRAIGIGMPCVGKILFHIQPQLLMQSDQIQKGHLMGLRQALYIPVTHLCLLVRSEGRKKKAQLHPLFFCQVKDPLQPDLLLLPDGNLFLSMVDGDFPDIFPVKAPGMSYISAHHLILSEILFRKLRVTSVDNGPFQQKFSDLLRFRNISHRIRKIL